MNLPKNGLPECYYDAAKGSYIWPNGRGGWMPLNETNTCRRLKAHGFTKLMQEGEVLTPIEDALLEIQNTRNIDYFGPVSGWQAGIHEMEGQRVLVSDSPHLIEPAEGQAPVIMALLEGMFDDEEHPQIDYFVSWLKMALECLYTRRFRPGQALILAGPRECGKSLLQSLLTRMFGGVSAKPYQYMIEATSFNADLFAAGHLMIEDEASSTDIRTRRSFGSHLKQFASAGSQRCHPKGRDPISLNPFWRMSVSVNDEPENLLVIPPLDESLADKIILLRCVRRKMPMPLETLADHEAFEQALIAELPAFIHGLLNNYDIPAELHSDRYGVVAFQHPALLIALGELAPETRLLELVDRVLFASGSLLNDAWEGMASELETKLRESSATAFETRNLLHFPSACGTYLARLLQTDRVTKRMSSAGTRWTINPPAVYKELEAAAA